jgi:hypothetical protein
MSKLENNIKINFISKDVVNGLNWFNIMSTGAFL